MPEAVDARQAAFEDLDERFWERYDLIYAAAAMHWTDPATRWARAAALLRPDGVFSSFGGQINPADPQLAEAIARAREPFLDDDEVPSPDGTPPEAEMQWPGTELVATPLFDDVRQVAIPRRFEVSREHLLGHLGTVSAYLQLDENTRRGAFDAIGRVLPDRVELIADLTVHLARRASR